MKKKIIQDAMKYISFIFLFVCTANIFADNDADEEKNGPTFGVFSSYNYTKHLSTFNDIPGFDYEHPLLNQKFYPGFSVGVSMEWAMPMDLSLGLRLSLNNFKTELSGSGMDMMTDGTDEVSGYFVHHLNLKMSDFGIEPFLLYKIKGGLNVFAGAHLGMILQREYEYYDETENPNLRFVETNSTARNRQSGKLEQAKEINTGLSMGMNYYIPIDKNASFLIIPEFSYTFGNSNIIKFYDWKIDYTRFGLAFKYSPVNTGVDEIYLDKSVIDTTIIAREGIKDSVLVIGDTIFTEEKREEKGAIIFTKFASRTDTLLIPAIEKEIPSELTITVNTDTLIVNYNRIHSSYRLIPHIFFKNKSAEFIDLYITNPDIDIYYENQLEMQEHALNILGKKLKENPKSTIKIKGLSDKISEKADCKLADERARRVQEYLVNNWNIDKKRVIILKNTGSCSPQNSSETEDERGFSENRRVEIYGELFSEPTETIETKEYEIQPEEIIIDLEVAGAFKISEARYSFGHSSESLVKSSRINIAEKNISIYKLNNDLIKPGTPIQIELMIKDSSGATLYSRKTLQTAQTRKVKDIQRFALIMFDVDSDNLPKSESEYLAQFIDKLPDGAVINIKGYSDILGDKERNLNLSQRRAESVSNLIIKLRKDLNINSVKGFGNNEYPAGIHSYNTVFERFLSRTVFVEVIAE